MEDIKDTKPKAPVYDFFKENYYVLLLGGYNESRSFLYCLYIVFLELALWYLAAMAAYGAYVVGPRKNVVMDGIHVISITLFASWGLSSRVCAGRSLKKASVMINEGIYNYPEEAGEEEEVSIKSEIPLDIQRKSKTFMIVYSIGLTINVVLFPISQLLLIGEDDPRRSDPVVNPYLPPMYFVYNPFPLNSTAGFWAGYAVVFLTLLSVYSNTTCMSEVFVVCAAQLKLHSKLLNRSIANLQKRALRMFSKNNAALQNTSLDELFENREYQKCLYACFKANIQHHQALLRFKKACQPYCGSILLNTVTIALVCYACGLYLILADLPLNYTVCYIVLLITEQTYVFYVNIFGEEILEESGKFFESLYALPWFCYSKSFNKTVSIMMVFTMKPLSMRALILDVAASLETYGDLVIAVYKIMNLAKHSDVAK